MKNKNDLTVFNFEANEVRTILKDGEPWFIAKDVCEVLELSDVSKAVSRLDEDEKGTSTIPTLGGQQKLLSVNEAGLYDLIFASRKPEAKKFRKWVTQEVIPSIRKHGAYMTPTTIDELLQNPDLIINLAIQLKEEQQARKKAEEESAKLLEEKAVMEMVIEESQPKLTYYDSILGSRGTMTITEIGQDYDLSGQALNDILRDEGVQYKQGNRWLLTKKHMGNGYIDTQTIHIRNANFTKIAMRWTQKGRLFIHALLQDKGIHAVMDNEETESE